MQHTPRRGAPLKGSAAPADHVMVFGTSALGGALRTTPYTPPSRFAGRVDHAKPAAPAARSGSGLARLFAGTRTVAARGAIAVACTAMSALYFWLAYHIVFHLAIGPIVGTVSVDNDWGIHSGDILALPLVVLGFVTGVAGIVAVFGKVPVQRRPRLRAYRPAPVTTAALS